MFHIVNRSDQKKGAIAAVEFEGHPYGAGISFFQGNREPGKGPGLHKHPYPETCVVFSGRAAMVVDGQEVIAGAGDVVVIGPETPHRFTQSATNRSSRSPFTPPTALLLKPSATDRPNS